MVEANLWGGVPSWSWHSGEPARECRPKKGRRRTQARGSRGMVGHDRIAVRETSSGRGQRRDKQGEAVKLGRCGTSRFSAGQRDRDEGCGVVLGRGARRREEAGAGWIGGGVPLPSPLRHDTTAVEEPFCVHGSIRLSLFFYYELLTRTCLSGSSLISSLPSRLPGGFFPFRDPIREAHSSL